MVKEFRRRMAQSPASPQSTPTIVRSPAATLIDRVQYWYVGFSAVLTAVIIGWILFNFDATAWLALTALTATGIAAALIIGSVFALIKRRSGLAGGLLVVASLCLLVGGVCGIPSQRAIWFIATALPALSAAILLKTRWILVALLLGFALVWVLNVTLLPSPTQQQFNDWLGLSLGAGVLGLGFVFLGTLREAMQARVIQHKQMIAGLNKQVAEEQARSEIASVDVEQERHRLAALLSGAQDGVVITDEQGTIMSANPIAHQLLDDLGSNLEGKKINQWMRDVTGRYRVISRERDNDRVITMLEMENDDKTVVRITQVPIRNTSGSVLGTIGFVQNQTRATEIEQMHSQFLDLLTRDMRNPLTSILSAQDTLLASNIGENNELVLHASRRSTTRLLDLVNTLLDMERLQHDPNVLHRVPHPLRPLIETSIAHATPQAQQRSINLVLEYGADGGTVSFDAPRMQRVMMHLLDNAINNSPAYSTVRVQASHSNNIVQIRISDQGASISPEAAQRLFDRFSRSTTDQRTGSLGLAFCKLVIEAHRGRIWVETSPGKGSTFAFSLPASNQ